MRHGIKEVHELRNEGITIPNYLEKDINALLEGLDEKVLHLDCLANECYGSINMALVNEGLITEEQAKYMRDMYAYWSI